jgi:Cellulose biosynthesis protein BcsS
VRVERSDGARYHLFAGGDIWRNGDFAYGGLLWSPGGLDREGFTLKAVMSGGLYRYDSGAPGAQVTGREFVAQLLPGWRFKREQLEVKVFVGLDLQDHLLSPDDPSSGLQRRRWRRDRSVVRADVGYHAHRRRLDLDHRQQLFGARSLRLEGFRPVLSRP